MMGGNPQLLLREDWTVCPGSVCWSGCPEGLASVFLGWSANRTPCALVPEATDQGKAGHQAAAPGTSVPADRGQGSWAHSPSGQRGEST